MTTEELLRRREQVLARAKVLCSVQGSGFHRDDPQTRDRLAKGDALITEKLVALKDDDRIHLVGECAARARAGIQVFHDGAVAARRKAAEAGTDLDWTPVERHAFAVSRRVLAESGDALCLPTQDWNGVLFALTGSGLQCVTADAVNVPDEEAS